MALADVTRLVPPPTRPSGVGTLEQWRAGLSRLGLPPHTEQHVTTMAQLHRKNRYDRATDGVERVTGVPAQSIETFVAARRDFYMGRANADRPKI